MFHRNEKLIDAQAVVKEYKNGMDVTRVLKEIDFYVKPGELVAITGRSGSGKSTLLYQLGLLDHPTAGSVLIEGVETTNLSGSDRTRFRLSKLGYVFQNYALLPSLSALENVMVPLLMQGTLRSKAAKQASQALDHVGLGDRLDYRPSQLSGGQQQRVSIARAIGNQPSIIFADEPTANLDSETSEMVMEAFLQIHKAGQTIVMVTHEPDYAAKADRTLVLSDGKFISAD